MFSNRNSRFHFCLTAGWLGMTVSSRPQFSVLIFAFFYSTLHFWVELCDDFCRFHDRIKLVYNENQKSTSNKNVDAQQRRCVQYSQFILQKQSWESSTQTFCVYKSIFVKNNRLLIWMFSNILCKSESLKHCFLFFPATRGEFKLHCRKDCSCNVRQDSLYQV